MHEYRQTHIPISPTRRPGIKTTMETITIHNTANPRSTAVNERNWLVNPTNQRTASWHIVIDEQQAIEAIPLDEVAWHAGNRKGNYSSIGIEVCESGNQQIVWQNTVNLVAQMLYERAWDVSNVTTHQAWSGKNCPRLILPRWSDFIADVGDELASLKQSTNNRDKVLVNIEEHKRANKSSAWSKCKDYSIEGFNYQGRNYIPIVFLRELGYEVSWDQVKKVVILKRSS